MKFCRFNKDQLGLVEGALIKDVTAALEVLPSHRYPFPQHDLFIANLEAIKNSARPLLANAPTLPLESVDLLCPIANPGKIMAAPVNYLAHLAEAREQHEIHHNNRIDEIRKIGLFLKSTSSLVGASSGIRIAFSDRRTDHEAEFVVIVGATARNVSVAEAMSYIAGYCGGLDITTRGPEERSLRKSSDTYAVLGPCFVTADELVDPSGVEFSLTVNGELRQHANTRDLVMGIAELVAYASSFYTLEPGDVLFTGTPEGVGPISPGDQIVATFAGVGTMTVKVS